MKRILIVDVDDRVRCKIARHAHLAGYEVAEASEGDTAVSLCRESLFDLVVLAILLPGMDGFRTCQIIRTFSSIPILMLSTQGSPLDRIRGLEVGADDYMVKPFCPRELMLRISTILKRGTGSTRPGSPNLLTTGGICIDLSARRVMVDGHAVSLTPKEFDLLVLLAHNRDIAFSRKQLLNAVWGGELPEETRTLDTHIKQIRHAIDPYSSRIVTLRGVGYRFEKE